MPLRRTVESIPETIQEILIASKERHAEGLDLILNGRRTGGIYLLGYAAEMILKAAYFRFEGASLNDLVPPRLPLARKKWEGTLGLSAESYHSVIFWARALRANRHLRGRRLDPVLDAQLAQRSRRLYQAWWIGLRYHRDCAADRDAQTVLGDVSWLRRNESELWR